MTKENYNTYVQRLAERLDEVTRYCDAWDYDAEDTENCGVSACINTIKDNPLAVIEYLLDNIETMMIQER